MSQPSNGQHPSPDVRERADGTQRGEDIITEQVRLQSESRPGLLYQSIPPFASAQDPRIFPSQSQQNQHHHPAYRTTDVRSRARSGSANGEGDDRSSKRQRMDTASSHTMASGNTAVGPAQVTAWTSGEPTQGPSRLNDGYELRYVSEPSAGHPQPQNPNNSHASYHAYDPAFYSNQPGPSGSLRPQSQPASAVLGRADHNRPPQAMIGNDYGRVSAGNDGYSGSSTSHMTYPSAISPGAYIAAPHPVAADLSGGPLNYAYPTSTSHHLNASPHGIPLQLAASPHASPYPLNDGGWQTYNQSAWPTQSAQLHSSYLPDTAHPPPPLRISTAPTARAPITEGSLSATSAASMALRYPSPPPPRPSLAYVPTSGPYVPPVRPYITTVRPPVAMSASGAPLKTSAVFVNKLYTMLEDPNIQGAGLLRWSDDGMGFVCPDPAEFARLILPQFFKHNNWHSFVRQLNMYGFNKQINDPFQSMTLPSDVPVAWEFRHPIFKRGDPVSIASIRRRAVRPTAPSSSSGSGAGGRKQLSGTTSPSPGPYYGAEEPLSAGRHAHDQYSGTNPQNFMGQESGPSSHAYYSPVQSTTYALPPQQGGQGLHSYPGPHQPLEPMIVSGIGRTGDTQLVDQQRRISVTHLDLAHGVPLQSYNDPTSSSSQLHMRQPDSRDNMDSNWQRLPPIASVTRGTADGIGPYVSASSGSYPGPAYPASFDPVPVEAHHDPVLGYTQRLQPLQHRQGDQAQEDQEGSLAPKEPLSARSRRQSLEEVAEVGKATVELLARDVGILSDQAKDMVEGSHALQSHDEEAKKENQTLVSVLYDKARAVITDREAADIERRINKIDDLTATKDTTIEKAVAQSETLEATTQMLQQHVDTAAEAVAASLQGFDTRSSFGSLAGTSLFPSEQPGRPKFSFQDRLPVTSTSTNPDAFGPFKRRRSTAHVGITTPWSPTKSFVGGGVDGSGAYGARRRSLGYDVGTRGQAGFLTLLNPS